MANNLMKKATVFELIDEKISAERYYGNCDQMVQGIIALEEFRELLELTLIESVSVHVDYIQGLLDHQAAEVQINRQKKTYQQVGYRKAALDDLGFRIKFMAGLVDRSGKPLSEE